MVRSNYCKQRFIQLYFTLKLSYATIVSVLKAEGLKVPKKTMWATIKKYKAYGTISRLPGSGRPYKLTREILKTIEDRMNEDDETTATQLTRLLGDQGHKVTKTTILRARKILGWTFHGSQYCQLIRQKNKEKRVTWARENLANDFEDVVWTDESMIQLENNRTFGYRKVGMAPKPKPRPKNPYKVMVRAGISKKGATNLCVVNGSVDSLVYQEILRTHLLPFLQEKLLNGEFQQDNAPCHTSLSTRKFLEDHRVTVLKTPPKSPELNPIENLWHELKHYVRTSAKPRTKKELLDAIRTFWATVTPEKCRRYIDHLRKVMPRVLELNGHTNFIIQLHIIMYRQPPLQNSQGKNLFWPHR